MRSRPQTDPGDGTYRRASYRIAPARKQASGLQRFARPLVGCYGKQTIVRREVAVFSASTLVCQVMALVPCSCYQASTTCSWLTSIRRGCRG